MDRHNSSASWWAGQPRTKWESDEASTAISAGGDGALDADLIADPTHLTYSRLAMWALPSTVLVGADGRVQYVHPGQVTPESESELSTRIKAAGG